LQPSSVSQAQLAGRLAILGNIFLIKFISELIMEFPVVLGQSILASTSDDSDEGGAAQPPPRKKLRSSNPSNNMQQQQAVWNVYTLFKYLTV